MNKQEQRLQDLQSWIQSQFLRPITCKSIPGDASFRHYYRIYCDQQTFIGVDSPIEHENMSAFIAVAKAFAAQNLCVPTILAVDHKKGFLLLSDLGDKQYFRIINETNVDQLYEIALHALLNLQACKNFVGWELPKFDATFLMVELDLFKEWYLIKHLGLKLTQLEQQLLDDVFSLLIQSAQSQPQVCVHRDYHSRNLMHLDSGRVGIIDFQDAVLGPITYDVVSLLRDCYLAWSPEVVERWMSHYEVMLVEAAVLPERNPLLFSQWFDWMGMQRHLKVLGIFSRLFYRDHKPIYLNDMPRILNYVLHVCSKYPQFHEFKQFLLTQSSFGRQEAKIKAGRIAK